MKKYIFSLIVLISITNQNIICCDIKQMDSLFYKHIAITNHILDSLSLSDFTKINTHNDNCFFWHMLMFVSDFKFEQQGYSHQLMINRLEVKMVENWYKKNRKVLNCEKIIPLFYAVKKMMNTSIYVPFEPEKTFFERLDKQSDENFKELDSLRKLDTFIFFLKSNNAFGQNNDTVKFKIVEIKSQSKLYIIIAERNDSLFKIVSYKRNKKFCKDFKLKIKKGEYYHLSLKRSNLRVASDVDILKKTFVPISKDTHYTIYNAENLCRLYIALINTSKIDNYQEPLDGRKW